MVDLKTEEKMDVACIGYQILQSCRLEIKGTGLKGPKSHFFFGSHV
jgi:hypothetical protein